MRPVARSSGADIVSLGERMSPLLPAPRLGKKFGLENLWVKDESQLPTGSFKSRGMAMAITMARRLAREEGILAGGSAGLNVWLALEVARELDRADALVVTILCDTGERYLSKVFNDEWMQENQMLEAPRVTVEQLLERRPANAPALVSVAPSAALRQALNLMSTYGVSQIPVLENGECVGGLIEGTLMTKALAQPSLLDRPVRELMEQPFPEVSADTTAERVGSMLSRESPATLVRKDGKLIGIVSRYDVLQQLIGTR